MAAKADRLELDNRVLQAKIDVLEVQLDLQQQVIAREHARISSEIQEFAAAEAKNRA